jgi:uncharacterized membrane protein
MGLHHITQFDAHQRLVAGLGISLLTYAIVPVGMGTPARLIIGWLAYAFTILGLMWMTILMAHPRDLPQLSRLEDSSRILITAFVISAAIASLFAVVNLLSVSTDGNRKLHVTLAILAVTSAWALVHTVFTLRYAHLFYGDDPKQKRRPGGLEFPNDSEPDYLDFAYFSFVIGMTSQVSDVAISAKRIRRLALAHGILSFLFNAVIVALTISGLSSLL